MCLTQLCNLEGYDLSCDIKRLVSNSSFNAIHCTVILNVDFVAPWQKVMYHPVYTLLPISVTKDTRSGRPLVERSKMRARPLITPGSKERITPRIHSLGDKSTCVPNILPTSSVVNSWDHSIGLQVSSFWVVYT